MKFDVENALHSLPPAHPIGPTDEKWMADDRVSVDLKEQWVRNGFSVLKGAFSPEQIAAYNAVVAKVRIGLDDGKDENGYGDRIGQLHQKEPDLLEFASNKSVLDFLTWAFGDEPVLFGSLNFEKGTQQDAHIDAIFFWPEPSYSMAGCWVALEDIDPDAGPLFYIAGSHEWPFYHSEHLAAIDPALAERRNVAREPEATAEVRGAAVQELGCIWTEVLHGLERKNNIPRLPLPVKAGDIVFWHSLLAHGGSPRVNPKLSRKSVVFHYIGRNTKLYTFEQFMLRDKAELQNEVDQGMNLASYKHRLQYMRYPYFVTYNQGKEIVHPLEINT